MIDGMELYALIPAAPDDPISWKKIERSPLSALLEPMRETPQDPVWHGEGNVWEHTKLVCQALVRLGGFWELPERRRQALFLAALLHDAGKPGCTRLEDGVWTAPSHGPHGARLVRRMLWQELGMCGTEEARGFRECICSLIRYHTLPLHFLDTLDPEKKLRKVAAQGELAPEFSLYMLSLLSEADVRGRICDDMEELLENVALFRQAAEDAGCLNGPKQFPTETTQRAYFSKEHVWPEQPFFDDTWGEVILLCGLPGTGKDTWIARNCPELPVVSLDALRAELGVSPVGPQGMVVEAAKKQAKALLRQKCPFVWNATNVQQQTREKLIRLFEDYHASIRLVYLETDWETNLHRNENRAARVPQRTVERMLEQLEVPERWEARQVEWLCV